MRIAIVEDERDNAQQMQDYLTQYAAEYHQILEVTSYPGGVEFLEDFRRQFDIILLDVSMPVMDGMETARRIRAMDEEVVILFVTNLAQYAIRGYEVEAADYLLKPISYFAFSQRLNRVVSRIAKRASHYIVISHKTGAQKVKVESICYVESAGHDLVFHTVDGNLVATGTMKEVEERLAPFHFYRCNKGYLVSLQHVDGVADGCALVHGDRLLISRPRKNGFMEALTEYIGGALH